MHGNLSTAAHGTAAGADMSASTSPSARGSAAFAELPADPSPPECPDAFPGAFPDTLPDETPPTQRRVLRLADRDATLRRATGSDDPRVHDWLVNELSAALNMAPALDSEDRENRVWASVSALCDIAPRDTMEGMLATQMVALHSAALGCLRRAAAPVAADRARDADLCHAARLLHVFQRHMRVRDDRRNPVLAHSLTGGHAPDAAGALSGPRVRPAGEGEGEDRAAGADR